MEYTENGILGIFEPRCKIRFLSDPKPEEEYIAVPASDMVELIACQMKMAALEAGGVDNWTWYGESIGDFLERLPDEYGIKFWEWVHNVKAKDETAEEFVENMDFEDFAQYEIDMM